MKTKFLLFFLMIPFGGAFAQMYILNEDFANASGTTPPANWNNITINGGANDLWHFDNPGDRTINYPVIEPFAIFDSENYSNNNQEEEAALETPFIDASGSSNVLLSFHHTLVAGQQGQCEIHVYNGSDWILVKTYNQNTSNPQAEIVDITGQAGGVSNTRLRFIWKGNGSGYWAIDNIRLLTPLPLDAGVVSIDSPEIPYDPGTHNVKITLGNFGYENLNSTTIRWLVNGEQQADYDWNGNIPFGQTVSDINIGSYNFEPGVYELKVWQEFPNGSNDPNPNNDTAFLLTTPVLCGTYTIGGTDPDFEKPSDAALALNLSGISCPVVFQFRDGEYQDIIDLRAIEGSSETNTITFTSESDDNTKVTLSSAKSFTVQLDGTKYITFNKLGFGFTSQRFFVMRGETEYLEVSSCLFTENGNFQGFLNGTGNITFRENLFRDETTFDISDVSSTTLDNLLFEQNTTTSDEAFKLNLYDCNNTVVRDNVIQYGSIKLLQSEQDLLISDNSISGGGGISVAATGPLEISGNRLSNINAQSGIKVTSASGAEVFNNFVHMISPETYTAKGIELVSCINSKLFFNSVNVITEAPLSSALRISSCTNLEIKNNIFSNCLGGAVVDLNAEPVSLTFDYNDYYHMYDKIAFYDDSTYTGLPAWAELVNGEANGYDVNPFFTTPDEPAMNQMLLNNHADPISGIDVDIDGTVRNPTNPDIGAKEYDPCEVDAGINKILEPDVPVVPGEHDVVVRLQNHGTEPLTSVIIQWTAEGEIQPEFNWTGSLPEYGNEDVNIGSFEFGNESVDIKAWTELPNGIEDCNHNNDTSQKILYGPLCGEYTIGGIGADYANFEEAVADLKLAGISCPVTFYVRDGEYHENVVIPYINGVSNADTITFVSEAFDSTRVVVYPKSMSEDFIFKLDGAEYINFVLLGYSDDSVKYFKFVNACKYNRVKQSLFRDVCRIKFTGNNHAYHEIAKNHYAQGGYLNAMADQDSAVSFLNFSGNLSPAQHELSVYLSGVEDIKINQNSFVRGGFTIINTNAGHSEIRNNFIQHCNTGGFNITGKGIRVFSGNWIGSVAGGIGLNVLNMNNASFYNNFVNVTGTNNEAAVSLTNVNNCEFFFNSLSNYSQHSESPALYLEQSQDNNIINNIFSNNGAGFCIETQVVPSSNTWDYNNYYSQQNVLAMYQSMPLADFDAWKESSQGDGHSINHDPLFVAPTSVQFSNVMLNNKGTPHNGVVIDIVGDPRHATEPDPGAREYDPCFNDATLLAIGGVESPVTPGEHDVTAMLSNNGVDPLTSVTIEWWVNDQPQQDVEWTGNLSTGLSEEVVLGAYDFGDELYYDIKANTKSPNGQEDCKPCNDSTRAFFAQQLCGVYTVGGINPDFENLQMVSRVLNAAGISCSVVFKIRDGEYADYAIISNVAGVSEEATITFESESSDSSMVTLNTDFQKASTLFTVIATDYMRFRNLGFGDAPGTFDFSNSHDVLIEHCLFNQNASVFARSGSCYSYNILNNRFKIGGSVHLLGSPENPFGNVVIANNSFLSNIFSTLSVSFATNSRIDSNYMHRGSMDIDAIEDGDVFIRDNNIFQGSNKAMQVSGAGIREISRNRVTNVYGNAIEVADFAGLLIVNNFVNTMGNGSTTGIFCKNGGNSKVVFNSISILSENATTEAFKLFDTEDMVVRNNIFSNEGGGLPVYLRNVNGLDWDFNAYYSTTGNIGQMDFTVYDNLAEWGQQINGDANSDFVNPFFVSNTELRPHQRELNGAGITIPGILLDIDGEIRNNIAPDVGADEFMVDFGVTQLLSPTLDCSHGAIDSVTIFLRQFGDIPFIDLKVAFQVNGGQIFYETIPGTIYNDIEFTFTEQIDISPEGEYNFKIWLVNSLDDNPNNDTLFTTRYSYPAPVVDFTYDNYCTWTEVRFEGEAEVISPYTIESFEWDFGDGEVSLQQNPSHLFPGLGNYEVTLMAFSDKGCFGDTTKIVSISRLPVSMDFETRNELCKWDCTGEVTIDVSGGEAPYNYYVDDELLSGNQATNLCYGEHVVKVVDGMECAFTDTFNIATDVVVDLNFTADPLQGYAPLEVEFTYEGQGAEDIILYFGDGQSDTSLPVNHFYHDYGEYQAFMVGNSGSPHYCVDTSFVSIFVEVVVEIDAPDFFTPNGDGHADYFGIETFGIKKLTAWIYDRWGGLVNEIPDMESKWDGRYENGKDAPDGVYYYMVEAIGQDGETYYQEGSVMLIREVLEIIPNPAGESTSVGMGGMAEGEKTIEVYHTSGRRMMMLKTSEDRIRLETGHLQEGVYIIRVFDNKNVYFGKLLKK